jgi:hypothetical protein
MKLTHALSALPCFGILGGIFFANRTDRSCHAPGVVSAEIMPIVYRLDR